MQSIIFKSKRNLLLHCNVVPHTLDNKILSGSFKKDCTLKQLNSATTAPCKTNINFVLLQILLMLYEGSTLTKRNKEMSPGLKMRHQKGV